ncbi:MAG: DUF1761 domain-containing protein [Pseudomonadales bacterium]|nr:DUF1761 domain-containing protein [Pseudomonadales bacterium]
MEFLGLNIAGIITATFTGMVLGGLWYSPVLFGKQWMTAINKTPETIGTPTGPMMGSIVASLLTATGISILYSFIGIEQLIDAIKIGLCLGVLIVFPALLSDNLFCGWGTRLLVIQSGYRILAILLMSIAMFYVV